MPDHSVTSATLSRGYKAVANLHHAYLTGLILTTITHRNKDDAAELVFRTFKTWEMPVSNGACAGAAMLLRPEFLRPSPLRS